MSFAKLFFLSFLITSCYLEVKGGNLISSGIKKLDKKSCRCKLKSAFSEINEDSIQARAFPSQVILSLITEQNTLSNVLCQGTIINRLNILVPGHCVVKYPIKNIKIEPAIHNPSISEEKLTFYVEKIESKPIDYVTRENDIAIVKLKEPIDFIENFLEPACYGDDDTQYYSDYYLLTSHVSKIKNERNEVVNYPVLKEQNFKDISPGSFNLVLESITDECPLESDGPVFSVVKDLVLVEGMTSRRFKFEVHRGRSVWENMDMNSRFSYYKEWFESKIGSDKYCSILDAFEFEAPLEPLNKIIVE